MDRREKTRLITLQTLWLILGLAPLFLPVVFVVVFIPLIIITAHFFVRGYRMNAYFLAALLTAACVLSGGDAISILFSVLIVLGVISVVVGLKMQSYLIGAIIAGATLMITAVIVPVCMCAFLAKKPADFVHDYVKVRIESTDKIFESQSQIKLASHIYYLFYSPESGEKIQRGDSRYNTAVKRAFLEKAWEKGENEFFYSLMGTGAIAGVLAFLAVLCSSKEKAPKPPPHFIDMRLDKRFFLYVFLPVFLFSFLGYIPLLKQVAATVFFALAAVPAAFSALALLAHTANRIKFSALKAATNIGLCVLGLFSIVFPSVLISISFLGVADSVLNIRRLIDFVLDEGEFKKNKNQ